MQLLWSSLNRTRTLKCTCGMHGTDMHGRKTVLLKHILVCLIKPLLMNWKKCKLNQETFCSKHINGMKYSACVYSVYTYVATVFTVPVIFSFLQQVLVAPFRWNSIASGTPSTWSPSSFPHYRL